MLKKKCKDLWGTKVQSNKDTTYINVTKYCARGVTFAEQAAKDGVTILDTSGAEHSSIWANKFGKKQTITEHLSNLDIKDPISDANVIKSGCAKAKEKNKQLKNFEVVYSSYKLIYTKQEGDK